MEKDKAPSQKTYERGNRCGLLRKGKERGVLKLLGKETALKPEDLTACHKYGKVEEIFRTQLKEGMLTKK